ncbi:MAG: SpoIIE family protein phosphatase [Acidobacteria bacterium]|nr:SpoIIE family protein phosphatase [Acidobacteriota bacterium]
MASRVKAAAASQVASSDDPGSLLAAVNAQLLHETDTLDLVSAAYVFFDPGRDRLRFAIAAHPAFLMQTGTAHVGPVPARRGPLLGMVSEA